MQSKDVLSLSLKDVTYMLMIPFLNINLKSTPFLSKEKILYKFLYSSTSAKNALNSVLKCAFEINPAWWLTLEDVLSLSQKLYFIKSLELHVFTRAIMSPIFYTLPMKNLSDSSFCEFLQFWNTLHNDNMRKWYHVTFEKWINSSAL